MITLQIPWKPNEMLQQQGRIQGHMGEAEPEFFFIATRL